MKKLIGAPVHRGAIFQEEADELALVLLQVKIETVKIYLMIDPDEDLIVQARFFTYGGATWTAIAETYCSLMEKMKTDEAFAIDPARVEAQLREKLDQPVLSPDSEEMSRLSQFGPLFAAEYTDRKKAALILKEVRKQYSEQGLSAYQVRRMEDAKWIEADENERWEMVEQIIEEKIRPMLLADGGDAVVIGIDEPATVRIEYRGNCSTCYAGGGSTLYYIEDQLRKNAYSGIRVETVDPDLSSPA